MLIKIICLLLLLIATDGFAHLPNDSIEDETIANTNTTTNLTVPIVDDITAALNLDPALLPQKSFKLLDTVVPPSTAMRLSWQPNQSLDSLTQETPVLVVNGMRTGPVLCLTAAVHGDELNGIEIVRRILYGIDPKKLSGTVIGVPIVNLQGFQRTSRYLTDRRDLNRYFPGNPLGSSAARIAYSFFKEVINHCNLLVDIHTGSSLRTNLPQVRANLHDPEVSEFAQAFGMPVILHSVGTAGMLRHAAVDIGIPAVTLETGKSLTLQEAAVTHGVKSIETLLSKINMLENSHAWHDPESIYYHSAWVRVNYGGILFSNVELGEAVSKDKVLGIVTDPITNTRSEILSPHNGRIIGMAVDQVVMPGFAGFHIGIKESEEKTVKISNKATGLPNNYWITTPESE